MNIENLLKEIDDEKEKKFKNMVLNEEVLKKEYHLYDSFFVTCITGVILFSSMYIKSINPLNLETIQLCNDFISFFGICSIITMISKFFVEYNLKKTYSISYLLSKLFLKKNIKRKEKSIKNHCICNENIDNIFLKKIALNMNKSEFKDFLKKCAGQVSIKKLEAEISYRLENNRKTVSIDKLADAIYEENQHLISGSKDI